MLHPQSKRSNNTHASHVYNNTTISRNTARSLCCSMCIMCNTILHHVHSSCLRTTT